MSLKLDWGIERNPCIHAANHAQVGRECLVSSIKSAVPHCWRVQTRSLRYPLTFGTAWSPCSQLSHTHSPGFGPWNLINKSGILNTSTCFSQLTFSYKQICFASELAKIPLKIIMLRVPLSIDVKTVNKCCCECQLLAPQVTA